MRTLWENYSGSDLELRKYKSRISDSILQRMSDSGTQVYGGRDLPQRLTRRESKPEYHHQDDYRGMWG